MKFRQKEINPRSAKVMGAFFVIEAIAVAVILLGRFVFHWF